ncbi:peptidyl-prolyl cis-trans isomerase, EpsD family [Aquitalea sp. S1-19]|nr:peptidyl-prolyl cis-trans isomerase, EpsD family [Aquitalea sp. S1-19]
MLEYFLMKRKILASRWSLFGMPFLLVLVACGEQQAKPATQVAAIVNGNEITVHQLNAALQSVNPLPVSDKNAVQKKALEHLIEQRLLSDKAIAEKLDRDPQVMMAMENARLDVLAKAWLNSALDQQVKPDGRAAIRYYNSRPELFSERKIYRLYNVSLANQPGLVSDLQSEIDSGKSISDIVAWLNGEKISANVESATVGAEALPMDVLKKLAILNDGELILLDGKNVVTIIQVVASQHSPVSEEVALPQIQGILIAEQRNELMGKLISQLKKDAKLEYKLINNDTSVRPASSAVDVKK